MQRVHKIAIFSGKFLSLAQASGQSEYLKSMVKEDQDTRNEWKEEMRQNGGWSQELAVAFAKRKGTSVNDLFGERSKQEEFTKYNFNYANFSKEDWNNYWLIVQHCDWNPAFQAKALEIIKRHLGKSGDEYKYLSDRISCAKSGVQTYGTQNPDHCVIDPKSPVLQEAKQRCQKLYGKS